MPSVRLISFWLALPVLTLLIYQTIQWCIDRVDKHFRKKYMNIVLKNLERLERLEKLQRILTPDHD